MKTKHKCAKQIATSLTLLPIALNSFPSTLLFHLTSILIIPIALQQEKSIIINARQSLIIPAIATSTQFIIHPLLPSLTAKFIDNFLLSSPLLLALSPANCLAILPRLSNSFRLLLLFANKTHFPPNTHPPLMTALNPLIIIIGFLPRALSKQAHSVIFLHYLSISLRLSIAFH